MLVHRERQQLELWRQRIAAFLAAELRLELKADQRLRPLGDGIDFLGYVVRPTHTLVRRRVIAHTKTKLSDWERRHVCDGVPTAGVKALETLRSVVASYYGHFRHAKHWRLHQRIIRRFPWLQVLAKS